MLGRAMAHMARSYPERGKTHRAIPTAIPTPTITATSALPATPTATAIVAPEPTATATATSTPEPTPTPPPRAAVCPTTHDEARKEFTYLPSEQSFDEAVADNCGTRKPLTLICPSDWEHSGTEITYDPDEYGSTRAVPVKFCGEEYLEGEWRPFRGQDRVDRNVTWSGVYVTGRWIGDYQWAANDRPEMVVQCHSDRGLDIVIVTGGYLSANVRSDVIAVTYSFGGEQVATDGWNESLDNEAAFVPREIEGYSSRNSATIPRRSSLSVYTNTTAIPTGPRASASQGSSSKSSPCSLSADGNKREPPE